MIAWIASSSIRTIRANVNICKRLYGNHSRMTRAMTKRSIHNLKMYQLFQDSILFMHCVPNWHNKHERVETKRLHQCMVQCLKHNSFTACLIYILSPLLTNQQVLDEYNKIVHQFLWEGKGDKIKRSIMISAYESGGLKMPDLYSFN